MTQTCGQQPKLQFIIISDCVKPHQSIRSAAQATLAQLQKRRSHTARSCASNVYLCPGNHKHSLLACNICIAYCCVATCNCKFNCTLQVREGNADDKRLELSSCPRISSICGCYIY
ncbi:unnamed protein product [Ceratitis capitata]|uniref:(Mediterranean fruit fly) hypothetical protein n=1 Tax=Ceratitis capitata TaxID=7213 RepID=A0A811U1W4_CERCA|nr:unnamed protein product [Ceratitis capitata]